MVMPLDLFLTDPTVVSKLPTSRTGYKELGDYGQSLSERAYRDKVFGEEKRQFDTEQARRSKVDKGTIAYHEDLVSARREASRNALEGKKEARVTALLAQMRKSANANKWDEVESIRAELTRMGYATEESDTEFAPPEDTAAAIADAGMPKPPAPKVPAAKGPKPDPAFLGTLSQLVANEKPGEGAIEAGDPLASPFPWEASGMPAPPKKKGPGGRFTIKDPQGNLVQTVDVPMEMEKDRQSIEAALAPYIDDPQNPEAQAAMRRASAMAQKAIATGTSPDQARREAMQAFKAEMQRFKTQRLPSAQPAGGGGGSGISKEDRMRLTAVGGDVEKVVDQVARDQKLPSLNEARRHTQRGMAMLQGDRSGFRDVNAMAQLLREMSGLTVSDNEYGRYVGGGSKLLELETKVRSYTAAGKLPDELISELREVFLRATKIQDDAINNMGDLAANQVKGRLLTAKPEEAERLSNTARDYFKQQFGGAAKPKDDGSRRKALDDKLKGMGL